MASVMGRGDLCPGKTYFSNIKIQLQMENHYMHTGIRMPRISLPRHGGNHHEDRWYGAGMATRRILKRMTLILLLLWCAAGVLQAQNTVTGTVTDAENEPLIGVNIQVKNTNKGTATDFDGRFTLEEVAEDAILTVSYIGYQTQEVAVAGQTEMVIVLSSDAELLDEVVVVGYGVQRSREVINSVATIAMKEVQDMPVAGIDQALSGQIAGMQISTSNGLPGGGPQIQIRGISAVGAGSEPLFVVDGFPIPSSPNQISNPINDIAPQDIESVTILKDASATSIYGSRGSNGVVLITTKRGDASGENKIQFSVRSGIQQVPDREKPNLMNAREFAQFKAEGIIDQIRLEEDREARPEEIPEIYRNYEQLGEGTDWFDVITRTAAQQEINLSIMGGGKKFRNYMSAGYLHQDGVVRTTGYRRINLRTNMDLELSSKIRLGLSLAPTLSFRQSDLTGGTGRNGGGYGEALVASPIPPVYNEDGSYNAMIDGPGGIFAYPNPLMSLKELERGNREFRILTGLYAEVELAKQLRLRSTFNVDWMDRERTGFRPSTLGRQNINPPTIPQGYFYRSSYLNWLNENTLHYEVRGQKHHLEGLGGLTFQKDIARAGNFTGHDFPDDDVKSLNAAGRITGNTDVNEWSLISYLLRVNYQYDRRYLVTGTLRSDGSSRFGPDNRWGLFPSAAVGWRVINEPFMRNLNHVSEFKIRASYGHSGNFKIGNYTYMSHIVSNGYVLGGNVAGGRTMSTMGNANLGWEKTVEYNLGIDLGLFEDRIFIVGEIYNRITDDLLLNVEIPYSSGFTNFFENRGKIRNRGLELAIDSRNVVKPDFSWSTNVNFTVNRNQVLALGKDDEPIHSGASYEGNPTHITMVGQPIAMFFGYVYDGLYQNWEEVNNQPAFPGAVPGNMRALDINGDGVINPIEDFAIVGNPYPDFVWGMRHNFSYKSFDLAVLTTGSVGAERIIANRFTTYLLDGLFNVSRDLIDRWRSPENPGNGVVPTTAGSALGRRMFRDSGSQLVEKNDYIWIKNITLGWNLPDGLWPQTGLSGLRLYASIQNPFIITQYPGRNPEVTNYGNQAGGGVLVPGFDSNPYPVPIIYTAGLNLFF